MQTLGLGEADDGGGGIWGREREGESVVWDMRRRGKGKKKLEGNTEVHIEY